MSTKEAVVASIRVFCIIDSMDLIHKEAKNIRRAPYTPDTSHCHKMHSTLPTVSQKIERIQ